MHPASSNRPPPLAPRNVSSCLVATVKAVLSLCNYSVNRKTPSFSSLLQNLSDQCIMDFLPDHHLSHRMFTEGKAKEKNDFTRDAFHGRFCHFWKRGPCPRGIRGIGHALRLPVQQEKWPEHLPMEHVFRLFTPTDGAGARIPCPAPSPAGLTGCTAALRGPRTCCRGGPPVASCWGPQWRSAGAPLAAWLAPGAIESECGRRL